MLGTGLSCAAEPTANRAKVDEEEEEDPLVRRKEEVVRLLEKASAKGKNDARAKKELLALCSRLEAKNEKNLTRLLPELCSKIVDEYLHQNDLLATGAQGHLEVLKWARSQDPPCHWSRSECKRRASFYRRQHIIDWIDQREDESDVE